MKSPGADGYNKIMPKQKIVRRELKLSIPRKLDETLEQMALDREMTRESLYLELMQLAVIQLRKRIAPVNPWHSAEEGTEYSIQT